jgi:hypothetical protein
MVERITMGSQPVVLQPVRDAAKKATGLYPGELYLRGYTGTRLRDKHRRAPAVQPAAGPRDPSHRLLSWLQSRMLEFRVGPPSKTSLNMEKNIPHGACLSHAAGAAVPFLFGRPHGSSSCAEWLDSLLVCRQEAL